MTYWGSPLPIRMNDAFGAPASLDVFGRQRVSNPLTIFDSKQVFSAQALSWDTPVAGGGTAVYTAARASTLLTAAAGGQSAIRQSRRYFNYQPGKSLLIKLTFVMTNGVVADVSKRAGYFDAGNGLFLDLNGVNVGFVQRSNVSGVVVDTRIAQAAWNYDRLDGTQGENNPSGLTLDISQSQILFIALEWLGAGSVWMGFFINGVLVPCHRFDNANIIPSVYMRTPNLPVRYECTSTGGNSSVESICCTVESEGGQDPVGITRSADRGISNKTINTAAMEQVIAIRLNPASPLNRATVIPRSISLISINASITRWMLALYTSANYAARVAGATAFTAIPNSPVQFDANLTAVASRIITLGADGQPTDGTMVASGYISNASYNLFQELNSVLTLASNFAGDPDVLVLGVRPETGTENYMGAISWFEPQ